MNHGQLKKKKHLKNYQYKIGKDVEYEHLENK